MTIRRQPEDFLVDERVSAAFEAALRDGPARDTPFVVYRLTKTSLTTPDAVQRLARTLRSRSGDVGYAGLKDKHARTSQIVSIGPLTRFDAPATIHGPGWSAARRGWVSQPVTSKAIEGNRFTIVVRGLTAEASAEMDSRAAMLTVPGGTDLLVVNYFGDQRFGSARHGKGFVARRLIEGDFESALRLAIGTPARKDVGAHRTFTRLCATHWGRWEEILNRSPRCPELAAVSRLAAGGTFRDAFDALPEFFRLMCVEAYQSHLWNATARRLAERAASSAPEGQRAVARTDDAFGEMVFPAAWAVGEAWRDLIVPLLAPKTKPVDPWAGAVGEVLAEEGIALEQLKIPGLRRPFFGEAPRTLFVRAEGFVLGERETDDLDAGGRRFKRVVSFDLARGAYATVVLRALGQ